MGIIIKKIIYLIIILGINFYVCSFLSNKLTARVELRRGYLETRAGGLAYPFIRLFKYLSKDYKLNIWEFFIFLFSFLIWTVIPISSNLILVDIDFSLLIGFLFFIIILFLNLINSFNTSYNLVLSNVIKKTGIIFTFFLPLLFCSVSIVLINKTLSLKDIVNFQYQYWNIIYQPLGFIIVFASALLQMKLLGITGKNPILFSENTEKEGDGIGRLIARLSYYSILFFLIMLINIFYLGGWQNIYFLNGGIVIVLKFYIIFIILILLDKATPKLDNYYYLISINWKFLMPVAAVNFIITFLFFILRNVYKII
ncbi:MAG: NADH-quinone oxidoreductase subunit H [Actinobacteria bacterium]|nr:NADH-quinone oxidoreductase subunit H [Actinomycetota bacterium]